MPALKVVVLPATKGVETDRIFIVYTACLMEIGMCQFLMIISVMLCVTCFASGQSDSLAFKNDLRIFRRALEETHPGLYRFTSRERFDIVFDSIDRQITSRTHQLDFFRLLSKIESLVREGHTFLRPSKGLAQYVQQQKLFPFQVTLSDTSITLKKGLDESYNVYEGLEIQSINGKTTGQIIAQLAASTGLKSGYNNSALINILSFENNFSFAYYYFIDTTDIFLIEFDDHNAVNVHGRNILTKEAYPQFPQEADPPMSLLVDSVNAIALIKITTFAHWMVSFSKQKYVRTFSDYFTRIGETGIEHLIIDVRNNRGGEEMLAAELLTYLVHREFKIYRYIKAKTLDFDYSLPHATRLHFAKREYHKTDSGYFKYKDEVLRTFFPKGKNHFNGTVYVLSNGGALSATNTMLSLIRTHRIGVIIGQESGGVYGDVDGRKAINLTLPFSGIQLGFPALSFSIDSENGDKRRGVIPDHILKTAGRDVPDSELAFTYKLIQGD